MDVYTPTDKIVHNVNVYFNDRFTLDSVHVVQYDDKLPILAVTMFEGDGSSSHYILPTGAIANIRLGRPDGHFVYNPALGQNSSGDTVYFEITQAMTMIAGNIKAVIEIMVGETVACSSYVNFIVDRNPIQEGAIEASDEFKTVVEYAEEAQTAAETIVNMTVGATTGEPGSDAEIVKSGGTGEEDPVHLQFTIPRGETGPSGDVTNIAEEFSTSKTYKKGDYVLHNNKLHICIENITTAGAWNASKWAETTIGEGLKKKVNQQGYFNGLSVADADTAKQLASRKILKEYSDPYNYIKFPDHELKSNRLNLKSIIGGTLAINQLCPIPATDASTTQNGITFTDNRDGSYTISTDENGATADTVFLIGTMKIQKGHKIYLHGSFSGSSPRFMSSSTGTNTHYLNGDGFYTIADTTSGFYAFVQSGTVITTPITAKPNIHDLTAQFGTIPQTVGANSYNSIADYVYALGDTNGISWLYKYFPILNGGYIPYSAPTLASVCADRRVAYNDNLWDEEYTTNGYYDNTGTWVNYSVIQSKNFIPVVPKATYSITNWSVTGGVTYWDINKQFISRNNTTNPFVVPDNCYYIMFNLSYAYGTTYKHDITIGLYYGTPLTYVAYDPTTYSLGHDTLRGIYMLDSFGNLYCDPTKNDTKTPDGEITRRMADIDLSTLTWIYNAEGGFWNTNAALSVLPKSTGYNDTPFGISDTFPLVNVGYIQARQTFGIGWYTNGYLYVYNGSSTTRPTGHLYYQVAEPTTESGASYTELQKCHNWGMEELTDYEVEQGNRAMALPVGHVTEYLRDNAKLIDDLFDKLKYDDIIQVINIKDNTITMGEILTALNVINTVGDHVFFDVATLNTGMYLCTIYMSEGFYRIADMVTGFEKTGFYNNDDLLVDILNSVPTTTGKHYTVQWDKVNAKGVRLNDAASITDNTTNFGHFGSVNPNYDNPFDSIYPWSGRKLCNVDIPTYMTLTEEDDIKDCVVAWEGDVNFSYEHQYGVWVYTPAFFGRTYEVGNYRYFDVTDEFTQHNIRYEERIVGRWFGCDVQLTIGGVSKHCLLPTLGINLSSVALSTIHTYAKNYSGALIDIYDLDPTILMMIVEYTTLNSQNAIGSGCSNLYLQSSIHPSAGSSGTTITISGLTTAQKNMFIPGAIVDIGTSDGGMQTGRFMVVSASTSGDVTMVTLNASVTVTTSSFISVHGLANLADSEIGSKSGYIGTNGYVNAYYRGQVIHGNRFQYVLGVYRQQNTNKVYIAKKGKTNLYDALNIALEDHIDSGSVLPTNSGYVAALSKVDGLAAFSICTETGGSANSANPVGDYQYIPAISTANTILLLGGASDAGAYDGVFYGHWNSSASGAHWICAAFPSLPLSH